MLFPTRCTHITSTLLDHVLVNSNKYTYEIYNIGPLDNSTSDHNIIVCILQNLTLNYNSNSLYNMLVQHIEKGIKAKRTTIDVGARTSNNKNNIINTWVTQELVDLMHRRDYKLCRNKITSLKCKLKREFYDNKFARCNNNSKHTWKVISE
ncbi:hypothetical protein PR048_007725, partial [Dryococelus australis]